jgi:hypothetical protein
MILVNTGFHIQRYYKYRLHQTKLHSPVVPVTTEFDCILALRAINEILTKVSYDPLIIVSQAILNSVM